MWQIWQRRMVQNFVAFFYTQVNPIKDVEIRVEKPLFYPLWFAFQSEHECFPMW